MSAGRLSASVEATGLIRRTEADGGFATVLRKGDPDRGALLIVVRGRGAYVAALERSLTLDGRYQWASVGPAETESESESEEKLAEFLKKRVSFDQDLWLIELDIAQPERFIAETTSTA